MSCGLSREALALHVEGDLSASEAAKASAHVAICEPCATFLEQLRARQSLMKSLRRDTVSSSECSAMRREVMSIVSAPRHGCRAGWMWRIERAAVVGFQRRSFALAAVMLVGVVSVSVLAQMRDRMPEKSQPVAVFEGRDTLRRPEGYRDWIVLERPSASRAAVDAAVTNATPSAGRVYINPAAYLERARSGRFPEGTLMVWEATGGPESSDGPHKRSSLLVSVKSRSRFDGGWGSFDFTGPDGTLTSKAQALPEASGCRTCHRPDAASDNLIAQLFPVL